MDALAERSLAVHEASHAVLMMRLGIPVDFAKLQYGFFGGLQGGYVRTRAEVDEDSALDNAAVYAAGALGQEMFLVEQGMDPARASRIATFSGSLDGDDLKDMQSEFGVSLSAARTRAERLVLSNYNSILAVAVALEERGKLSGSAMR